MFAALLLMVLLRFCFWACCVIVALVLALAAVIGWAASGLARSWNPERADILHEASRRLIVDATRTAMFADNHRRWLLPNTQRSKRY